MRVLPHHQDTGGFFVAVLEKLKPLPWENQPDKVEIEESKPELSLEEEAEREAAVAKDGKRPLDGEKKPWGPQRKRKRIVGYREDPFVFFKDEKEDVWPSIKSVYAVN